MDANTETKRKRIGTRCVHAGELRGLYGAPHSPIFNSTTFAFADTRSLLEVVDGIKKGPLYTRYGMNPTIVSLEEKLAALEGAESALVFCSGMAAESAVLFGSGARRVVCLGDAYGGTLELLAVNLSQLGIQTAFLKGDDFEGLQSEINQGASLVFLESPTNPTLEIIDIKKVAAIAHAGGASVVVDNTFATPINQSPLALGADLVVHSATKYLGGHSDITAGAVMGDEQRIAPLRLWRKNLGSVPAPETCALLSRSIKTLHVRVDWQNRSAQAIAEAMEVHPAVRRVLYPGLPSFTGYALAVSQMRGMGGMLTLDLFAEDASPFVDRLELFLIAPSLGGAESLVTQPVTTTHHGLSEVERARRGITGSMVRFSIGLEDPQDLIEDLRSALEAAGRK